MSFHPIKIETYLIDFHNFKAKHQMLCFSNKLMRYISDKEVTTSSDSSTNTDSSFNEDDLAIIAKPGFDDATCDPYRLFRVIYN